MAGSHSLKLFGFALIIENILKNKLILLINQERLILIMCSSTKMWEKNSNTVLHIEERKKSFKNQKYIA